MEYVFSNRISSLKPSAIREILKVTASSSVIPFAAGNPAPEAFPLEAVGEIFAKILRENPVTALQYGVTEGFEPLRKTVKADLLKRHGIGRDFDDILITSGAQQVMGLCAKVFCNEGDVILCETPSFIGSLNSFRSYNACLKGIEIERDGMNLEKLENALKNEKNVKFIYTIPNFQNPTGITMSLEKRKALYALAKKYSVLILEDNPYGETRALGEDIPSIKSMDSDGLVIYAGSFSKIFAPGIRVGFAVAPQPIIAKMTVGKQGEDVHTPVLNQMLVHEWMTNYDYLSHITKIKRVYGNRIKLMCDVIDQKMNDFFSYIRPEGGLFIWCSLPTNVEMMDYVKKAAESGVAVVPGTAFAVNADEKINAIRLNFSTPNEEAIIKGIEILSKIEKS